MKTPVVSSRVVFSIKLHTVFVNHIKVIEEVVLIVKVFIFYCLMESFNSSILFRTMWISKVVRNTPRHYLFVKFKEIFATIVSIDSGNLKWEVFPHPSNEVPA